MTITAAAREARQKSDAAAPSADDCARRVHASSEAYAEVGPVPRRCVRLRQRCTRSRRDGRARSLLTGRQCGLVVPSPPGRTLLLFLHSACFRRGSQQAKNREAKALRRGAPRGIIIRARKPATIQSRIPRIPSGSCGSSTDAIVLAIITVASGTALAGAGSAAALASRTRRSGPSSRITDGKG